MALTLASRAFGGIKIASAHSVPLRVHLVKLRNAGLVLNALILFIATCVSAQLATYSCLSSHPKQSGSFILKGLHQAI